MNTRYHQSSLAITKDGKTMYFTRNNYVDGKVAEDKKETSYLKIYSAQNINGEWKNVKELDFPVNGDGFSSAHPALNADESELYFVSDRNNSFGNSDLYVVSLKNDGLVGKDITRLGDEINTLGRETYPFVDSSGVLYFSSDGHPGLGGLDVFAAVKDQSGLYHVINLGDGVNTNYDDFAYIIQSKTKKGYFSSNRSGNDDIYSFIENRPVAFDFKGEKKAIVDNEMEVIVEDQKVKLIPGEDLMNTLKLKPIYFDYNGSKIRESSKAELNKIVELLNTRPSISLKINSYTDSRGQYDFNMKLSQNRAKATVDYIVAHGISSNRVIGEGFGDSYLINNCTKDVQCAEAEHQKNRRSEFLIVVNNQ